MVPFRIGFTPASCANRVGKRMPCAFRLMSILHGLPVEGRITATTGPARPARAERRRPAMRFLMRETQSPGASLTRRTCRAGLVPRDSHSDRRGGLVHYHRLVT